MKRDYSVSMLKGNIVGALFGLVPSFILSLIYILIYDFPQFYNTYQLLRGKELVIILSLIFGMIIHEIIHGETWKLFSKGEKLNIKYGFYWKALTPYAHCKEPIEITNYRLGTIMPSIIVGLLPYLYGLILNNLLVLFFGLFFILAAGGDFLITWMLRNEKPGSMVQDNPSRAGCYVIDKESD